MISKSISSMALISIAGMALAVGGIVGCATPSPTVEQKVAVEAPSTHPGELAAKGFDAWANSSGLNPDQKTKLASIHSTTAREAFRIRDEITKTKSAMFKELAKGNYDDKTIEGFKNRIVKLDQDRLSIMFKALASVEKTLGKGEDAQKYFRFLEMIESQPIADRTN